MCMRRILQSPESCATPRRPLTFVDQTNGEYRYVVSRCVPAFLTMLEKPGRYYLNLTVDPTAANVGLVSCGLELRN